MTDLTEFSVFNARGVAARQQFIDEQCDWWPTVYKSLMPVTTKRKVLEEERIRIEKLMASDFEAFTAERQSPWKSVGPVASFVSNEGLDGRALVELGLKQDRILGFPAPVKEGDGPNGQPFMDHPEVEAATANAHRTREYIAFHGLRALRRKADAAGHLFVQATNDAQHPNHKHAKKLGQEADRWAKTLAYVTKSFDKLRQNPAKACEILRPAMTDAEQEAERDAAERGENFVELLVLSGLLTEAKLPKN